MTINRRTACLIDKSRFWHVDEDKRPGEDFEWDFDLHMVLAKWFPSMAAAEAFAAEWPEVPITIHEDTWNHLEDVFTYAYWEDKDRTRFWRSETSLGEHRETLLFMLDEKKFMSEAEIAAKVSLTRWQWERLVADEHFNSRRHKTGYVFKLSKAGVAERSHLTWRRESAAKLERMKADRKKRNEEHEAFMADMEASIQSIRTGRPVAPPPKPKPTHLRLIHDADQTVEITKGERDDQRGDT